MGVCEARTVHYYKHLTLCTPTRAQPHNSLSVPSGRFLRDNAAKLTHEELFRSIHHAKRSQLAALGRITQRKVTVLTMLTDFRKTTALAMPLLAREGRISIVLSPSIAVEINQAGKINDIGVWSYLIDAMDVPANNI